MPLQRVTSTYFAVFKMEGDAKRKLKDVSQENEDDEWIGPMPSEAVKPKKRKGKPGQLHNIITSAYYAMLVWWLLWAIISGV